MLMRKEVSTIDTTGLKSPLLLPPAPCPETISGLLPFRFHAGFRGRGLVLRGFSGFPFFPVDPINRSVLERWMHG